MFRPLNNRVLVLPDDKETKTESGILLTEKTVEKPVTGTVVVGNESVKEGDKVLFSKYGYDEVKIEGELHYVVSELSLLAIL